MKYTTDYASKLSSTLDTYSLASMTFERPSEIAVRSFYSHLSMI